MLRLLFYIIILQFLLTSCEEIYRPEMDTVSGHLVVDAKITNDISKSYVHLSRTRSFYDVQPVREVTGAILSLVELGGRAIDGHETSPGYYSFDTAPKSGKQYFLRINIMNSIYESKAVMMPPLPKITNFYTSHVESTVIVKNNSGSPTTYTRLARALNVDLPMTDSLNHYLFNVRTLLEWTFDVNYKKPGLFPSTYGWWSFQKNDVFHLVGPKDLSEPGKIIKHQLETLSYDSISALHRDTLVMKGWIIFIDQYGIPKESYDYHKQLNSQFAATGSLFDPIQTQVYGNILCKTNTLEKVYGYLDLNSYQQVRYFLILNKPPGETRQRQLFRFPEIPDHGEIWGVSGENPLPPAWWEE
jgi:hypothetical protein